MASLGAISQGLGYRYKSLEEIRASYERGDLESCRSCLVQSHACPCDSTYSPGDVKSYLQKETFTIHELCTLINELVCSTHKLCFPEYMIAVAWRAELSPTNLKLFVFETPGAHKARISYERSILARNDTGTAQSFNECEAPQSAVIQRRHISSVTRSMKSELPEMCAGLRSTDTMVWAGRDAAIPGIHNGLPGMMSQDTTPPFFAPPPTSQDSIRPEVKSRSGLAVLLETTPLNIDQETSYDRPKTAWTSNMEVRKQLQEDFKETSDEAKAVIYIGQDPILGLVKIGFTTITPGVRISQIEQQTGRRLENTWYSLNYTKDDARRLEKLIHTDLKRYQAKVLLIGVIGLKDPEKRCGCLKEWFHVDMETARRTVEHWCDVLDKIKTLTPGELHETLKDHKFFSGEHKTENLANLRPEDHDYVLWEWRRVFELPMVNYHIRGEPLPSEHETIQTKPVKLQRHLPIIARVMILSAGQAVILGWTYLRFMPLQAVFFNVMVLAAWSWLLLALAPYMDEYKAQ